MDLESLISQIISKPLFLRLKQNEENNYYHNHELTFDHLIKTKDIAQREVKGDFITNPDAKKLFLEFVGKDTYGLKKGDVMILTALLHDIGKLLSIKENNQLRPLKVADGEITKFPGHEYWGSTIVSEFTRSLLPDEITKLIAQVIKLHDVFNETYFAQKSDWDHDTLLNDVKSRAENLYKESLFNIYCDCFTATPFQKAKEKIIQIFNDPNLYIEREYVIT